MEWTKYNVGTTRHGKMHENSPPPHLGQFILGRIANVEHFALDFGLDPIC
jgi:hypothetical protein